MRDATRFSSLEAGALPAILRQGRRTIMIWMGLFLVLGICLNVLLPPVYRATARVEIRRPPDRSALTGQSFTSSGYQSENVSMITAAERIKDRMLLGEIATEFGPMGWIQTLPGSGAGDQNPSGRFQWAAVGTAKAMAPANGNVFRRTALEAQVDWLQTVVAVEPIQDTRLVDIKVEHHDPQAARTIADRLAQRFVADQCRQSADADTDGLVYLTDQLAGMRKSFTTGSSDGNAQGVEGPAVLQARIRTLSDAAVALNSDYLKARSARVELNERLARIAATDPGSLDAESVTPVEGGALAALQRDLENCRVQLASAREVYKSKHPRLVALESQFTALQVAFRAEQQRAVSRLKEEATVLASRERSAAGSRDQNDRALAEVERQFENSAAAHGELKAEQDLYGLLVSKIQQSRVEMLLKARPVEIVNAATVAPHPVRPRKALNLAVCLVTGLLFGSGQVLVRNSNRHTVRTPADVEQLLGLPLLGVIPKRS
jgi:polysaccharide biosynthesis transport protein